MTPTRPRSRTWIGLLVAGVLATTAMPASAAPGTRLWASRYDSAAHKADEPSSLAVSPDGTTVFVTGSSRRWPRDVFATLAYDASTGDEVWHRRYRGLDFGARPHDIAVSPDGTAVFVAGDTGSATRGLDLAIVAYDASTGATLWAKTYDKGHGSESADSIAVDPTSGTLFVTGHGSTSTGSFHVLTIAYDDATGDRLWVRRYDGPGGDDYAVDVEVSPDGSGVFVTGDSFGGESGFDQLSIGYDADAGTRRWIRRYDGAAGGDEASAALSVSPDSSTVFVTGSSPRAGGLDDYATVAYDAETGTRRWVALYDGPGNGFDIPSAIDVSPSGDRVFVTGQSFGGEAGDSDYGTVAYDTSTGAEVWVSRYDAGSTDVATSIVVSPNGSAVFVTGLSFSAETFTDFATVGYSASTGASLWTRRYDGPASGFDDAVAIDVAPDGSAVFVTGKSWDAQQIDDYATVAYATS